jgi:hypothetical protein
MNPIEKYPKFLSPSSLSMYEHMPITFYLTRMAPDPLKVESNTTATSLGTAIDGEIKLHICNEFGWTEKIRDRILSDIFDPLQRKRNSKLSLERLLFENIPKADMETLALGRAIGRVYCNGPMYKSLNIVDIEYHPRFSITDGSPINNVPIYCKLDATVAIPDPTDSRNNLWIPLDWKSTSGSPEQGYMMLHDARKCAGFSGGWHNKFRPGITFGEINPSWDSQLLTYHMAIQHYKTNIAVDVSDIPVGLPAMIEQICVGSSIRVARFVGTCGSPKLLYDRYSSMWRDIHSGAFTRRLIDNRMLLEHFASKERFY